MKKAKKDKAVKTVKKEKYVPLVGLTGEGEDYNVYNASITEKATGFAIGFVGGVAAAQIMFGVFWASLLFGLLTGYIAITVYIKHLLKKRDREILLQFRDMLDSLSNSFSAGRNAADVFTDALNDMKLAYNAQAPIVKELAIIVGGLLNGYIVEDLLKDMAKRCHCDDINSFAETFAACNRLGGNQKKIVSESRDIINDKIEIQLEIQTMVAAAKNDINIMSVMPFIIIAMMGTLGNDAITANTPLNIVVKLVALKINGKWGYINLQNEMVIDAQYLDAGVFSSTGAAPIMKSNTWNFIILCSYES